MIGDDPVYSQLLVTFGQRQAVLSVGGEIVAEAHVELARRLEDAVAVGCMRLEVDLADVTGIDDASLRELAFMKMRMEQSGRTLVVRGTPPLRTATTRARSRERSGAPS